MHPRTTATLSRLRQSSWFENIGVRDTEVAIVVETWDEAIASCTSLTWENLCLEAANQYRARLLERSPSEFSRWNDVVKAVKPLARDLVQEKIADIIVQNNLPSGFGDTVNWDILHLCMECEFADVFPPGYYASQAYWYSKGRFPCGWHGSFPKDGKLMIF